MAQLNNVGQLKEYIANLPDDMPIVLYRRDMEKSGYMEGVWVENQSMKQETDTAFDVFDHTPYRYEVYVEAGASGIPCLKVT